MAASILETLSRSLSPSVIAKASATYGESDSAIRKGITAAIAAVLAPLAARAPETTFTRDLLGVLKEAPPEVALLDEPEKAFSRPVPLLGDTGPFARLQSLLFGGSTQNITNAIASAAGLKQTTASSLFALAVPTVLGYLSRLIKRDNLDPASLGRLLTNERVTLSGLLPASLAPLLAGSGGIVDDVAAAGRDTFDRASAAAALPPRRSSGTWAALALGGLAAIIALWALMGRTGRDIGGGTAGAIGTAGYLS